MSRVLIVDDEPLVCWSLGEALRGEGHSVATAATLDAGLREAATFSPDAMFLDVRLPGGNSLPAIPGFRERAGEIPIIVMTAFSDLETAVSALRQGAFEYLVKPFDLEQATSSLRRALPPRGAPSAVTISPAPSAGAMPSEGSVRLIGSGPAMQRVFRDVAHVSGTDLPVLVTGETGTGKELVAQAIHANSPRAAGPFVPVCVAALNPAIVESELFGHAKGAFTGAHDERRGLFELAERGTLFLDEIGDTPPELQVKLLRVLESRSYRRVGSGESRGTNVRVVAATNRDLPALVAEGKFREDLYHRLRVFPIRLPPLRERPEDLPDLVRHFAAGVAGAAAPTGIGANFLAALGSRPWTGNIRELRNAVEFAVVMARGQELEAGHLPPPDESVAATGATSGELGRAVRGWLAGRTARPEAVDLYRELLEAVEAPLLDEVLRLTGGNRTAAARLLGLDRATLRVKLKHSGDGD
jgi:DNA-binding NtrC family response regulator